MKQWDQQLIDKFREGDRTAFKNIHNSIRTSLLFFAKGLIKNEEAAKDIIQESFIKLWKKKEDFKTAENVKAFLYISTRNSCLDFLKHQNLRNDKHQQLSYINPIQSEAENHYEHHQIKTQLLEILNNEIKNLPAGPRKVFELIYYKEMEVPDVAILLGISEKTVMNQRSTAIKLLKKVFDNIDLMVIIYLIINLIL